MEIKTDYCKTVVYVIFNIDQDFFKEFIEEIKSYLNSKQEAIEEYVTKRIEELLFEFEKSGKDINDKEFEKIIDKFDKYYRKNLIKKYIEINLGDFLYKKYYIESPDVYFRPYIFYDTDCVEINFSFNDKIYKNEDFVDYVSKAIQEV